MRLERLGEGDLESLLQLYAYLHEQDAALPPEPQIRAIWQELMTSPRHAYFGVFVGAQLVSTCALAMVPNLTRGCRPYGIVENVVTHAAHRKRGYGGRVVQAALAHAWASRCYKVMLLTGRREPATLRFYESLGFDPHGKQAFVAKPPSEPSQT